MRASKGIPIPIAADADAKVFFFFSLFDPLCLDTTNHGLLHRQFKHVEFFS